MAKKKTDGETAKTGFDPTLGGLRRHLHLIVDTALLEQFRAKCETARLDMSRAVEVLWRLWADGRIDISQTTEIRVSVQAEPAARAKKETTK